MNNQRACYYCKSNNNPHNKQLFAIFNRDSCFYICVINQYLYHEKSTILSFNILFVWKCVVLEMIMFKMLVI